MPSTCKFGNSVKLKMSFEDVSSNPFPDVFEDFIYIFKEFIKVR